VRISFPAPFPCWFCEYAAGRLPWNPVATSALAVAFVNPRQRSRGALLVAPRRHTQTISRMTAAEMQAVAHLVQEASRALTAALDPDGLHVFCNAGQQAGQSEEHVHFQIIPRYAGLAYDFAASARHEPMLARERRELAEAVRGRIG